MDWLDRMNAMIDYLEKHLQVESGPLDLTEAAKRTGYSLAHIQRMFPIVADITLSEYIRRRKLTQAALDLSRGEKVLEVALRYGYESPTAFTRAFTALHGIAPSKAKLPGAKLKSYPRIAFQLSVKGEKEMNYKIEKKTSFRLVGYGEMVTMDNEENFRRIPQIWKEACSGGNLEKMLSLSSEAPPALYGVVSEFTGTKFRYSVAVRSGQSVPEGLFAIEVPELEWAVFESIGPTPYAIQDVTKRIFSEWFPSSGYEHADGPELEWYGPGDTQASDYRCEVWIPVRKL